MTAEPFIISLYGFDFLPFGADKPKGPEVQCRESYKTSQFGRRHMENASWMQDQCPAIYRQINQNT